jgi:hypothetical protein
MPTGRITGTPAPVVVEKSSKRFASWVDGCCMSTANPGHMTSACRLHAGSSAQASKASPSREFTTHALLVGGEGSGLGAQGLQSMSFAGLVDAAWLRSIKASHLMRAITRDHTSVTPLPGTRDR